MQKKKDASYMKQNEASDEVNTQTIYVAPKSTIFLWHIRPGALTRCVIYVEMKNIVHDTHIYPLSLSPYV